MLLKRYMPLLKRAAAADLQEITRLCQGRIIGARILCYVLAYGFERDFLEVWVVKQEEKATGVIVRFYDDVTLLYDENADISQLEAFIGMFYFKSLTCTADVCIRLGFKNALIKRGYRFNGDVADESCDSLEEDDYRRAYKLISSEIPDSFTDEREAYLSFLSDFTFRKRRELARGVCTHFDGALSSVALTSAETKNSAIISGVACDRSLQKKGLGKKTVLSLVKILAENKKTAYVIALNESAEGFYEHIGFEETEKIAFIERENDV